jgi:Tfp pilus assembly protein PilO
MTKSILSILFIGASIMVFVLYVRPTYDVVQTNRANVARFDEALAKTREIQELKSSLLSRYNLFAGANLDRLQKMLPDNVDNVRLVLDMDGIASNYGIRIQNVAVQEPGGGRDDASGTVLNGGSVPNRPYQSLTLQFEVVSTYEEFVFLLRDLESSLRIVDLVSLTMQPRSVGRVGSEGSTVSEPVYSFGVALRTYWLP